MNIALLGYGTIGVGVKELLAQQDTFKLVKILRHHASQLTDPIMCLDIEEILHDDSIQLVIEAMSGIEPAYTYIKKALLAGKHVVTANKAVIAKYQIELHELAQANHVELRYEASCGGGIPWIMALMKSLRVDEINRFQGIFNGTCNYILDQMTLHNQSFQEALTKAQKAGFAEANPLADINGTDTLRKAIITARLAFHLQSPIEANILGIENINKIDIQVATQMNCVIKLLATGNMHDEGYEISVEPVLVPLENKESTIHAQYNIGTLYGKTIHDLSFIGQGAGAYPTANAILQDIIDIASGNAFHPSFTINKPRSRKCFIHSYILRTTLPEQTVLAFFKNKKVICIHHLDHYVYYIYNTSTNYMHKRFQQIIKHDAYCFMARIMRKDQV